MRTQLSVHFILVLGLVAHNFLAAISCVAVVGFEGNCDKKQVRSELSKNDAEKTSEVPCTEEPEAADIHHQYFTVAVGLLTDIISESPNVGYYSIQSVIYSFIHQSIHPFNLHSSTFVLSCIQSFLFSFVETYSSIYAFFPGPPMCFRDVITS